MKSTRSNFSELLFLSTILFIVNMINIIGYSVAAQNGIEIRCFETEKQALLKFKDGLVDDYGRLSSWDIAIDCCKWGGVHCDNRTNFVAELDLRGQSNQDFVGQPIAPLRGIVSSSLLELKNLAYLDLSFNEFNTSNIPEFIGSLNELQYLNLSYASFFGPIPPHLGNLSKLVSLDLGFCTSLSGGNLDWFSNLHLLEYLDLSYADLSEATNWVQSITKLNMSNLRHLGFRHSLLSGNLVEIMMNLTGSIENLEFLDLSDNGISGLLPNMSRFSAMTYLSLGLNQLSGDVPGNFLHLPQLTYLDLHSNEFTGSLPDFSVNPMLKHMFLSYNMFTGTLPESFGGLSELEDLILVSNLLEGVITEVNFMNLSRLQYVDLSLNELTMRFNPNWVPPFQLIVFNMCHCLLDSTFLIFLQTQKQLRSLDIANANFSSSIASLFGSVPPTLIHFNASNNQIYGSFPNTSIFKSSDPLEYMIPSIHVPSYIEARHLELDLSNNSISGSINFLCHHINISLINFSDNMFSDQIPDCFANFKSLRYLNLANNQIFGSIPDVFGSLLSLNWLHLGNNSLVGGIPVSLKNCGDLKVLDLQGNSLSDYFPTWIGDYLTELMVLVLRSNEIFGNIPLNICALENIQVLDLSSNKISGEIPKCLHKLTAMVNGSGQSLLHGYNVGSEVPNVVDGKYDTSLLIWKGHEIMYGHSFYLVKHIDLSRNNLVGEIPPEITTLVGLLGLNLSSNNLVGPIPQNIGMLRSLNFLDLSRNQLSGQIPTSLSQMNNLGMLNLSYNNLSGSIPLDGHSLTFDELSYEGNLGLCGAPLDKSCLRIPGFIDDETNLDHEEEDDDLVTEDFYISMIIGFAVGLWGILGTVYFNESFRYVFFRIVDSVGDFLWVRIELIKFCLRRCSSNRVTWQ